MAPTESNTAGRIVAGFVAALSVLLAASVLLSQTTIQREITYTSTIAAPESVPPDVPPPPSPLEIRAAIAEARGAAAAGLLRAVEAVPPVPWNEHGLARVPISLDAIRFDADRDRYVMDLDDGRTAILTLRPYVQTHLETVLSRYDEASEAVVVIDPPTGRVLALADDATGDAYAPGGARRADAMAASTFKVVSAAALLGEGLAEASTEVCFTGGSDGFDEAALTGNPATDSTCLSLDAAMAWSANLVFARLADRLMTPEVLQRYADAFGFNARIPFELPLERSIAQIPTDRLGFARAAAGFYSTWMTPLHGAMIQAAIANDGRMMVPTIVERIEGPDGTVEYEHQPVVWREPIDAATAGGLETLMRDTCRSGTARVDFAQRNGWPAGLDVIGKTGTLSNRTPGQPEPDPVFVYRWFTGYVEHDGASVAVGALVINTAQWHIKGTYLASEAILASVL